MRRRVESRLPRWVTRPGSRPEASRIRWVAASIQVAPRAVNTVEEPGKQKRNSMLFVMPSTYGLSRLSVR